MITHAIIAYIIEEEGMEVLFFCGFDHEPTPEDVDDIKDLLATNKRLKLADKVLGKDYEMTYASPGMVRYYCELDPPDEDAYYIDAENRLKKM